MEGSRATFSVGALGTSLVYKWYLNGVALNAGTQIDGSVVSGAASATLNVTGTTGAESDGTYTVSLTNAAGSVTSSAAVLSLVPPGAGASTFTGVGYLPGVVPASSIRAASEDGQIAAGSSNILTLEPLGGTGDRSVLWTSTAGMKQLAEPAPITAGTLFLTASDMTPDGAVIAGRVRSSPTANQRESAIWSNDGGTFTVIPEVAGYSGGRGAANALSGDGKVVYGWSTDNASGKRQAYRWTAATGTVGLGFLNASDSQSLPAARGCSSDGSILAGVAYASDGITSTAFIYHFGTGMSSLGYLPGGTWSAADVITPDGSKVLGAGNSTRFPGGEYFSWTQGGGMVELGAGDPSDVSSTLAGISSDGSLFAAGGYIHNANGYMDIARVFSGAGLNTTGWSQFSVAGISHNGQVLFGEALDPSGHGQGWVARFAGSYLANLSLPAAITRQPVGQTALAGGSASFSVGAGGGPSLAVQWFLNGVALSDGTQGDGSTVSGSQSRLLLLGNLSLANDGGSYTARVTGIQGPATSSPAPLSVTPHAVVTALLTGDPELASPLNLAAGATTLYVAGTNANISDPNRNPASGESIFSVPLAGGAATSLYAADNPQELAVLGADVDWIDPNSGSGATQILRAPAAGGGPVAAVYSHSVNPAIVSGTGLATDGTGLYALDSNNGQLYRLNADGTGLAPMGAPRYVTGPQTESIAAYQGEIYALDSGESSGIVDIVSVPTSGPSTPTTLYSASLGNLFNDPQCIAVGIGMIYVSDADAVTGQETTIWELPVSGGNPVVLVSGAPFNNISGLTFANGALYASDSGSGAIYKIQVSGPGTYPSITAQPSSLTVGEGSGATFTVSASGSGLSYQWYLNGEALSSGTQADGSVVSGSTSATLTLSGTTGAESDGTYTVVVSNRAGSTTSSAAVLSLTPPGAGAFSFTGVGDLPGGAFNSQVRAATDDGQIAVGSASVLNAITNINAGGDRPFLWTSTAGMSELPEPLFITAGTLFLTASDITPDGAVIAGRVRTSSEANLRGSAIWSDDGEALTLIPEITGYSGGKGAAISISSDGRVVYGWSTDNASGKRQAYRWTSATGTVGLGFLNGTDSQSLPAPRGCTPDGSVLVGMDLASDGVTSAAFIYRAGAGMDALGTLSGGTWSSGLSVTPDGVTVLGSGDGTGFPLGEYFTWTQGGGMTALGAGNPYNISNIASISADGQVFGGSAYLHNGNGFMAVDQALAAAGLNTTGWSDFNLLGITRNEKVLFGQATNPSGNIEGWVATVAAGYLQGLSLPASITQDPPNQTAVAGSGAGFGVGTSGGPGLVVQWYQDGIALADGLQSDGCTVSGSASPYLQLAGIPLSRSGGGYSAQVHDGNGNHATSASGVLTVTPQPEMTVLLQGSPLLGGPLSLASDGAYLYAAGTNLAGSSDPNTSPTGLSLFRIPVAGGAATSLYPALEPGQLAVLGGDLDWIDPSSGPGGTQILMAPAGGGGPVTAIFSPAVNPAIVSGTGLATDGTNLFALDSNDGQVYRLNADGSGLAPLGGARYATGPQTESIAVYQGNAYVLESGESSLISDLVSIPTDGSGPYTTVWDNSIGPFFDPQCVAVGNGMIYVSDVDLVTGQVTKIWELPVSGGNPVALVSGAPFSNISGLTFVNGALYVSDSGSGAIYQIQVGGP